MRGACPSLDVVDAVIACPERPVRRAFARNRHADPVQRSRPVDDPDAFVRADLASRPHPRLGRARALPGDVIETFLIRQELAVSGQIPLSFRRGTWAHRNPEPRVQAAGWWLWLTPGNAMPC
ncbi:hypothetical protein GCM10019016_064660 [Streptomyces prasinosporus]|uniref:Uncharacterized protein n=1 Tax=Streptomyces prasinosporus TaxID=68256 RepID=A0ABP6TY21_9ACTN